MEINYNIKTATIFQTLHQEIQMRISQDFEALDLSKQGLINLKERIKPPSLTWTYLVNDNLLVVTLFTLHVIHFSKKFNLLTLLIGFLIFPVYLLTLVGAIPSKTICIP